MRAWEHWVDRDVITLMIIIGGNALIGPLAITDKNATIIINKRRESFVWRPFEQYPIHRSIDWTVNTDWRFSFYLLFYSHCEFIVFCHLVFGWCLKRISFMSHRLTLIYIAGQFGVHLTLWIEFDCIECEQFVHKWCRHDFSRCAMIRVLNSDRCLHHYTLILFFPFFRVWVIVWVSAIEQRFATWMCWIVCWTRTSAIDSLESFPSKR